MEYFLGFLTTIVCLFIFNKMFKKIANQKMPIPMINQSRKFSIVKNYIIQKNIPKSETKTQSNSHFKKKSIKAFFWNDNVYWIEDGFLVTAKLKNNKIDETSKKRVDTYSLDKVELDRISFIVEKLTEGNKNDNGDSGK